MTSVPPYRMDDLSEEWFDCGETGDATRFQDELRRQMGPGHVLAPEELVCVAWRRHLKETVFWLPRSQRWAVVHLTWAVESDPGWPSTELCATWSDVVAELRERGRR